METLGNVPSEPNLFNLAANINVMQVEPLVEPKVNLLSPSKQSAAALEGSPMFTPLEVKFKNLKPLEESAKKAMSGRKYVAINSKEIGTRMDKPELEEQSSMVGLPSLINED